MTSNQQRAHAVIERALLGKNFLQGASDAVQALTDAGLITPDLLEIGENSAGEAAITGDGFYLEISGNEAIINDTIAFDQEHLKDLGLALLAAAEHMEKNANG